MMKKSKKENYIKYIHRVPQRDQVNENGYKRYIKKVEEKPRKHLEEREPEMLRIGGSLNEIKLRKVNVGFKRHERTRKAKIQEPNIIIRDNGIKLREYKEHQLHIPKRIIFTATRPARLIHLLEIIKGKTIKSPQDAVLEILERVVRQEIKLLSVWNLPVDARVTAKYNMIVGEYDINNKNEIETEELIGCTRIQPTKSFYYIGVTGHNNVALKTYNGKVIYVTKDQFEHGFIRH